MNKWLIGLVVLGAGVVVGWYVLAGRNTSGEATPPAAGTSSASAPGAKTGGVVERVVVTYSDSGFSPNSVTVKAGTTVTFTNGSSGNMWVASAVHPTHQLLPGFDQLKSVSKGGTYDYTFVKIGTWKYHNHMSPSDTGSVVVTE